MGWRAYTNVVDATQRGATTAAEQTTNMNTNQHTYRGYHRADSNKNYVQKLGKVNECANEDVPNRIQLNNHHALNHCCPSLQLPNLYHSISCATQSALYSTPFAQRDSRDVHTEERTPHATVTASKYRIYVYMS
jgi:hypothetical protein